MRHENPLMTVTMIARGRRSRRVAAAGCALFTLAAAAAEPWTGAPLPAKPAKVSRAGGELDSKVWALVQIPGCRLISRTTFTAPDRLTFDLTQHCAGKAAKPLLTGLTDAPSLARVGSEVWIELAPDAKDGQGAARGGLFRLVGDRLERVNVSPRFDYPTAVGPAVWAIHHDSAFGRLNAPAWSLQKLEAGHLQEIAKGDRELVTGLAALGSELVLALKGRETSTASRQTQFDALMAFEAGDAGLAAQLAGNPGGWLLHVPGAREAFPRMRPSALAVTAEGWLVVLGEGTIAGGLRDGVLVVRAPGAKDGWRLLARDLEMPGDLVQRGPWVCFGEELRDDEVVHCLDPARGLHVATGKLHGEVTPLDLETGPGGWRYVFRRNAYEDGEFHESVDAINLP